MSSITASSSIHLQMNGLDIQYNADDAGFTTISTWPVTITNSAPGPSAILNVICDVDLTISSSTGGINSYFIAGSQYITFDGSGNSININGVTSYPGFIQNGTSSVNGSANVVVKNFTTNVTLNSGSTLAEYAGWLCQSYFGRGSLGISIENCTNTGTISGGNNAGGICGGFAGSQNGSATLTSCTNSGEIIGISAGGICGGFAGYSGSATFTSCTNTGPISGSFAGGICGAYAGSQNGLGTFTNCTNTGEIIGNNAGGICGQLAGFTSGSATLTTCFSTGSVTGQFAGGIVGSQFAYNTNQICSITNCYSTGLISGDKAGGITGSDVGYTDNSTYTPVVNITSCYSLGAIATTCGGICGGTLGNPYTNTPVVIISNCYSYGALTGTGSGIVAAGLPFTPTQTSTYVANGTWSDASANSNLTGTPTGVGDSNSGASWKSNSVNTPYVLKAFYVTINDISATNTIHLQMNGTNIEYSADGGTWTSLPVSTWPVRITNNNPISSNILNVIFDADLTISSNYGNTNGYFIVGSEYITFDGLGNDINITGIVTNYPGLIQNGTSTTDGIANVVVKTLNTRIDASCTLISYGGWLCQSYFGKGSAGILIESCTNTGTISGGRVGGICGSFAGAYAGSVTLTSCTNTGTISGSGAGGICGQLAGYSGSATFTSCTNTGPISVGSAGGIAGQQAGTNNGSATFTLCTNTGEINGFSAGGICGQLAGYSGSATFTSCTNNGPISGEGVGGICGGFAGNNNGSVTLTSCTNTGTISGQYVGGICGGFAGGYSGSVTLTSCTNTGNITISGFFAGGICGAYAGSLNGLGTFTNCTNTGTISGNNAGGICGQLAGNTNGSVTLTTCFSTGSVTGQFAGGIVGSNFANDTSQTCSITNCYSTGLISGDKAGGITGANVGYTDNASYTPIINITSCYSLGAIASTCGGICGGWNGTAYTNVATINISNTYSYGALTGTGSGLVAVSLTSTQITLYATNTYVAAGDWSDEVANSSLTGTPNSPGITWTSIVTGEPYVLSEYNAEIYSPNSADAASNYTSAQGLFQPGFTYVIVYSNQVGATLTLYVAAYKGTSPDFTEYNINTFTITNTTGRTETITSSINPSNGILSFIVPTTPPSDIPCFLEDTKILCLQKNVEVYRKIQDLRKGDLVKTIYNQYMPIRMIGTSKLYNPGNNERTLNRLYKCSRENYPTLFEDLYITGCHSILVPFITYKQADTTKAILGQLFVTDNHCRLMACVDEKAEPYNNAGFMNIYHVALEHHDEYMNYGIYANGLLVESCSIDGLKYSTMRMLGEEEACCKLPADVFNIVRESVQIR